MASWKQPSANLWEALIQLAQKRNYRVTANQLMTRSVYALQGNLQRVETDFQRAAQRIPTLSPQFRPLTPGTAEEVEYRARLSGDPRPQRVSREDFRFYTQVMEAAILDADLYQYSEDAQNPRLTLLLNLLSAATGLAPAPVASRGDVSSPDAAIRSVVQSVGTEVAGNVAHLSGPLTAISITSAVGDSVEQYQTATDPEQRLAHFVRAEILRRARGDSGRARQMLNRLQRTGRLLDAQLEWFDRHRDHPAAGPAVPTVEAVR